MRKLRKTTKIKKEGYAVLELLFYIAFFVVLSLVVIEAMVVMAKSFKETSIYAEFTQGGSIMERMSREIRQASSISSIGADDLALNIDAGGTLEFKFVSPNIQIWETDGLSINIGNLNSPNIAVTALAFTQITTVKGKAVRVSLTLRDNNDAQGRLENFYDTITLRESY